MRCCKRPLTRSDTVPAVAVSVVVLVVAVLTSAYLASASRQVSPIGLSDDRCVHHCVSSKCTPFSEASVCKSSTVPLPISSCSLQSAIQQYCCCQYVHIHMNDERRPAGDRSSKQLIVTHNNTSASTSIRLSTLRHTSHSLIHCCAYKALSKSTVLQHYKEW
jgi:hypothetical protein